MTQNVSAYHIQNKVCTPISPTVLKLFGIAAGSAGGDTHFLTLIWSNANVDIAMRRYCKIISEWIKEQTNQKVYCLYIALIYY